MTQEEILNIIAEERDRLWALYLDIKDLPHVGAAGDAIFDKHRQTDAIWHRIADGKWPKNSRQSAT
jgi:hypothetical protein